MHLGCVDAANGYGICTKKMCCFYHKKPSRYQCILKLPFQLYIYCTLVAIYTPHFTLLHFTLHTRLYTLHFHTLHSTLHTLHSTLYTPHSTLYTRLYTPHFYTPHFTLYTPHCHTLHSTLCTPPSSAFHSLQCTGTVTGEKCRLFK